MATEAFSRKLIFFGGKGGVGKTRVSQAYARTLAQRQGSHKTLWMTFEDPSLPLGEKIPQDIPGLTYFNCEAAQCFEEYIGLKLRLPALSSFFVNNKLMRYLSQAAPGVHELVLLGKVWFETRNYDHVCVDLPSTGYGLAMFQSVENFKRLFVGGPIARDAEAMLKTFADGEQTTHIILALPEEMPIQESLELRDYLLRLFPANEPQIIVNRLFPRSEAVFEGSDDPKSWPEPLARSPQDYVLRRAAIEAWNLRTLKNAGREYSTLPFLAPAREAQGADLVRRLAHYLQGHSS